MDNESSAIQRRTLQCQLTFQRCIEVYPAEEWAENRLADFHLWSSVIKASASGRASLDYRVRDHPATRDLICDYLDGLLALLQRHLPASPDPPEATDSDEEDDADLFDPSSDSFGETRIAVKSILLGLARISSAIRKSGTKFRFKAADDSLDENELGEAKRLYMLYIFKALAGFQNRVANSAERELTTKSLCAVPFRDSWMSPVQTRLVRANLLRHNRILYNARSSIKPTSTQAPIRPQDHRAPGKHETSKHRSTPYSRNPLHEVSGSKSASQSEGGRSQTASAEKTATNIGSQYDEKAALKEPTPSVLTRATRTGTSLEYPSCPNPAGGGIIQCPYCGDTLTEDYYTSKSRWRGHVAHDLLPYNCIMETCPQPDEMYGTVAELTDHIRKEHSIEQWTCQHCNSLTASRAPELFASEDTWREHMSQAHPEAFQSEQLPMLATLAARYTLPKLANPFHQTTGEDPESGIDYLTKCLHEFALLALPPDLGPQSNSGDNASSDLGALVGQDSLHTEAALQGQEAVMTISAELDYSDSESEGAETRAFIDSARQLTSKAIQGLSSVPRVDRTQLWQSTLASEITATQNPLSPEKSVEQEDEPEKSESGDSVCDHLLNEIFERRVTSAFDRRQFQPEISMESIITYNRVLAIMRLDDSNPSEELAYYVIQSAKKVFSICLCSGLQGEDLSKAISQFMKYGVEDAALPITRDVMPRLPFFGSHNSRPTKPWNRMNVDAFTRYQWEFLAPIFSPEKSEFDLNSRHILPFIDVILAAEGSFSQVYRVRIHDAHYQYPTAAASVQNQHVVAVKELREFTSDHNEQAGRDWQRNIHTQQLIASLHHPHIIRFMSAIIRGDHQYIMYEWADMGSLSDLWTNNHRPSLGPRFVRDICIQLRGLTDALASLHNYANGSYRHGNLKPENILRTTDDAKGDSASSVGVFKLSGFTLAKFHTLVTQLRAETTTRFTTIRYQPPETVTTLSQAWSRLYDIWSLGCTVLEFIIWILYGNEELERFRSHLVDNFGDMIPFYTVDDSEGRKARLHQAVVAAMDALAQDPECQGQTAMGDMLRLVKHRLLVVSLGVPRATFSLRSVPTDSAGSLPSIVVNDLPSDLGKEIRSVEQPSRATALDVLQVFDSILQKGSDNTRYWCTGQSRQHLNRLEFATEKTEGAVPVPVLHLDRAHLEVGQQVSAVSQPPRNMPLVERMTTDVKPKGISRDGNSLPRPIRPDSGHEDLQDLLYSALVRSPSTDRRFLPISSLAELLSEDRVRANLRQCLRGVSQKIVDNYVREVCRVTKNQSHLQEELDRPEIKPFRKVFAILAIIGESSQIAKFLNEDVNDSDLPLVRVSVNVDDADKRAPIDLRRSRQPDVSLRCFEGWKQVSVHFFEDFQWTMLAPFFSRSSSYRDVHHYVFQDSTILPFILHDNMAHGPAAREGAGGSSRVSKVFIHPAHHNFPVTQASPGAFARKTLHSLDRISFESEVEMLKKFSDDRHPHLISLLATYEQFGVFNLIFPWAEADMKRYWEQVNPHPLFDRVAGLWVAEQCKGIASGVLAIHRYHSSERLQEYRTERITAFGHHGDIKPENVLWFPEPGKSTDINGTLKLSDFGVANFRPEDQDSSAASSNFTGSPSYRAPESDLEGFHGVGRSYDMWTLGCLYLEFLAWLLGGYKLVMDFSHLRLSPDQGWHGIQTDSFFELTRTPQDSVKARVKSTVAEFINQLHCHDKCSDFVHDFLNLIKNDLLIVKQDEHNSVKKRMVIEELNHWLSKWVIRCRESDDYTCKPAPYRHSNAQLP